MHRQKDPSNRNATAGDSKFEEGPGGQGGSGGRRVGGCGSLQRPPACGGDGGPRGRGKFKHNDELTRSRQRRLEEAGACPEIFPAPVRGGAGGFELLGWLGDC